jgi:SAM-dependent methyltransferase
VQKKYCLNCGEKSQNELIFPIDTSLKDTWGLNAQLTNLFNIREGTLCAVCGASVRAQGLARAILESKYGFGAKNLREWVQLANKNKLIVCELNSCHRLHDTLSKLKHLAFSEYGTSTQQDIENLTYPPSHFDIVLHSETLEHVPNPSRAMDECRKIIKKDGIVLFTTPVIWTRKTRRRAIINNDKIEYLLPPSHHGYKTDDYLVFFEYGNNIDKILGASIAVNNWRQQNYVFYSGKMSTRIKSKAKLKLKLQQRAAISLRKRA